MTITTTEFPVYDELTFEEGSHTYRLDGNVIPSVSEVMSPLSNSLYRGVDETILNKAAERGTAVHNAIENYTLYGAVDIDDKYLGYFQAFREWWKDAKPQALASECKVYHSILRYAGTADMPVIIDGKMILVDFKTSASINRMLTGVQLEAYAKAYESHGVVFDGKAILHLSNNGRYKWLYYEKNDLESWDVFGALLKIYNHIKKYK